jgi:outer membrane protein
MKKLLLNCAVCSALTLSSFATLAAQAGDMVIRGGATMVDPDSNKASVMLDGVDSTLDVSVDDNTQLGLNLVYFYNANWAVEVLAATPFKHDINVHIPEAGSATLAEVSHLPPTVSALYYFETSSKFNPYVGLGLNYTIFFDEEFENDFEQGGFSDLELDGSLGFSAQIGADYYINDSWMINASARYIDINTDATFKVGGEVNGSADVDIDPMVYSLMIGYKF